MTLMEWYDPPRLPGTIVACSHGILAVDLIWERICVTDTDRATRCPYEMIRPDVERYIARAMRDAHLVPGWVR